MGSGPQQRTASCTATSSPPTLFLVAGRIAETKILDFGLARRVDDAQALTRSGLLLARRSTCPRSRRAARRAIDTRSDVFSLGSVLFEACADSLRSRARPPWARWPRSASKTPLSVSFAAQQGARGAHGLLTSMLEQGTRARASIRDLAERADPNPGELADQPIDRRGGGIPITVESHELNADRALKGALRPRAQQRVLCAVFVGPRRLQLRNVMARAETRRRARQVPRALRVVRRRLPHAVARYTSNTQRTDDHGGALRTRRARPLSRCADRTLHGPRCRGRPTAARGAAGARERTYCGNARRRGAPGSSERSTAGSALRAARAEDRRVLERERSGGEVPRTLLGR